LQLENVTEKVNRSTQVALHKDKRYLSNRSGHLSNADTCTGAGLTLQC
jgi:hypothetical protein